MRRILCYLILSIQPRHWAIQHRMRSRYRCAVRTTVGAGALPMPRSVSTMTFFHRVCAVHDDLRRYGPPRTNGKPSSAGRIRHGNWMGLGIINRALRVCGVRVPARALGIRRLFPAMFLSTHALAIAYHPAHAVHLGTEFTTVSTAANYDARGGATCAGQTVSQLVGKYAEGLMFSGKCSPAKHPAPLSSRG